MAVCMSLPHGKQATKANTACTFAPRVVALGLDVSQLTHVNGCAGDQLSEEDWRMDLNIISVFS